MSIEQPVVWLPGEAGDTEITALRLNTMQTGLIGPIENIQEDVNALFPIYRIHPLTFSVPPHVDIIDLPPFRVDATMPRQKWDIWRIDYRVSSGTVNDYIDFQILVGNSTTPIPTVLKASATDGAWSTYDVMSGGVQGLNIPTTESIGVRISNVVGDPGGLSVTVQLRETLEAPV